MYIWTHIISVSMYLRLAEGGDGGRRRQGLAIVLVLSIILNNCIIIEY